MNTKIVDEIIENFTNEEDNLSSYTISSEDNFEISTENSIFSENNDVKNLKPMLLKGKRNDEFIFYNNTDSDSNKENRRLHTSTYC